MTTSNNNHVLRQTIIHSTIVFLGFSLLYIAFFAPILFSHRLLAPTDGLVYYAPAFYSPKTLWTNLIFGGYPLMGDLQHMTWYPPAMILSLIPSSWNAFVLLAYILAGCFAYCYTYTVTASRLAAIVTGIVYSMSGFMMSHLEHVTIIHAAAWMPILLCAVENLRNQLSRFWWVIGTGTVACCVLGGHPQIALYSLGLGGGYALWRGWRSPVARARYYFWILAMMVTGLGLCAIQIGPTSELSQLSVRASMTFEDFTSFSLSAWETPQLLFPYFFGSHYELPFNLYQTPRWGEWSIAETTGYLGFLPLLLGAIGAMTQLQHRIVRFWLCISLIALLLSFGEDTVLGHILYYVPLYNKFRAQGRHFVEFSLAVSVLAGYGTIAIQRHWVTQRLTFKLITASSILIAVMLTSMAAFQPYFQSKASEVGITQLQLLPWKNPAVGIPLALFGLSSFTLVIWQRWRNQGWSRLLLLTVLLLDLSSFGWFSKWQTYAPDQQRLQPVPIAQKYHDLVQHRHQRLFAHAEAEFWNDDAIFPNMTRLWQIPNASGYSPLILARVSELMRMGANGSVWEFPTSAMDRTFDLMSIKYVLNQAASINAPLLLRGDHSQAHPEIIWSKTDLGLTLGAEACGAQPMQRNERFDFSNLPQQATEIGLVTTLGCSGAIPDQAEVAQLQITDPQGNVKTHRLLAGRDTAEHAYDCPDVKPQMQHQRAQIFQSSTIERAGIGTCQTHSYTTVVKLDRTQHISMLDVKWTSNLPGMLQVRRMSLFNQPESSSTPITQLDRSRQWEKIEQIPGGIVYENQQVLPRTWLVSEAIPLKPEQVLTAIRTSRLPDGRIYDPKQMALVETQAAQFQSTALKPTDQVKILDIADTRTRIQTQTLTPQFLVLSDVFYPGWVATIDGQRTQIFQTNYVQRGVQVPAGKHVIEFKFEPLSFKLGVGITLVSLLGAAYWLRQRKCVHEFTN